VAYIRQAKLWHTLGIINIILILLLTCGITDVMVTEQNLTAGVVAAALLFILYGLDGYLQYAATSTRDRIAGQAFQSMHNGIQAILNQEPWNRPDPYPFAIAIDSRMRRIEDQAAGQWINTSQDIFEDHQFYPHDAVL